MKPRWWLFNSHGSTSLRSRLILLVLGTMSPLLIFAVAMVVRLGHHERATFQRGATERTRALLTAIDAELGSSITVLEAMATWHHLEVKDLQTFYEDATRVLKSQPSWLTINLATPNGQQLINLQRPYGTRLPMIVETQSFEQVLRTQLPTVGNLSHGPLVDGPAFTVRVPVMRDDIVRYVLTAVVKPRSIGALLASQHLPATWIGVVLDGNRHFVARTLEPERNVGALASENLRAALERTPEGWFYGTTVEGLNVYTSYSRSDFTGWSVAIGIPAAAVEATFRRSLLYVAFFGLGLVALGIAIAWILGSKTSRSIASLAVMAGELEAGDRPASSTAMRVSRYPSGIAEVDVVKDALVTAHRLIRKHSEERDRVEAKLRDLSERLQLAQEAGNIGTFERDLVSGEIKWSTSQEMLYGLAPGSFGGKHEDWARRVHPGDLARAEAEVEHTAQTHAPLNIEFRVIRPDGTVRWIASQARAFADESGKARRLLGVNIDITERKKAEEALLEADHRKDEFLAMLGHELRNPLGVINTSAQLLTLKAPPEPALIQLRNMIARQVEHMSRMLDDLLDVSRITRGQIRLKTESCDFTEIVRNIINDHRGHFDENGLRLIADLPDTPLWVMGDRTRLAQIVGNLLYNAEKFTDHGGTVTIRMVEAPGPTALLTVRDTGIGIEPEMLKHVFEPFIQSDHSIDRSRGGLGLGLALVKGLVELHSGEVGAQSDGPGRGSEFIISLPLHQQAVSPRGKTAAPGKENTPQRRILVIEDNPEAARSLQMYLELTGHQVEVAHSGPDGIEAARRFRPELVLCDIGLPGLDGYAVARCLRHESDLNGAYLIAVSGYGREGDQRRAQEAGFDLHLSKPVDLERIDAIIANLHRESANRASGAAMP